MSRGYYVPCAPFLYFVPESSGGQLQAASSSGAAMDVQVRQPPPPAPSTAAPFQYLIHEQAKSLVALQELQNEVGALLEFRELVMDTFPHLRSKAQGGSTSSNASSSTTPPRWGPGVRIRRKIQPKERGIDTEDLSTEASKTKGQPKSSEGGATSGSTVQDSGFSTETKEHHSSNSPKPTSNVTAADSMDELCHLLDIIQCKGSRLRDEVEELHSKMRIDVANKVRRGGGESQANIPDDEWIAGDVRSWGDDDESREVHLLRHERDLLLDKVTEMEAETLQSRARVNQLQHELHQVSSIRKDLEEQLNTVMTKHYELSNSGRRPNKLCSSSEPPTPKRKTSFRHKDSSLSRPRHISPSSAISSQAGPLRPSGFHPIERSSSIPSPRKLRQVIVLQNKTEEESNESRIPRFHTSLQALGKLDGVLSEPAVIKRSLNSLIPKLKPDSRKVAAILREQNTLELRRHLITTVIDNQALQFRLLNTTRKMSGELERMREENDDLRFQLEEKRIELEGTRARVRVLEKHQLRGVPLQTSNTEINPTFLPDDPNSSSTESAHDLASPIHQTEQDKATMEPVMRRNAASAVRGKKPSKIPLPPSKSLNKAIINKTQNYNNRSSMKRNNETVTNSKSAMSRESLSTRSKDSLAINAHRNSLSRKIPSHSSTSAADKSNYVDTCKTATLELDSTKDSLNYSAALPLIGVAKDSLNIGYYPQKESMDEIFPWHSSQSEYFDSISSEQQRPEDLWQRHADIAHTQPQDSLEVSNPWNKATGPKRISNKNFYRRAY